MATNLAGEDDWCSRCQAIDFNTLFSAFIDPEEEYQHFPIQELGALDHSSETSRCAMCRLLYAVRVPVHVHDREEIDHSPLYILTVVYSPALLDPAPDEKQYIVPVVEDGNLDYREFQVGTWVDTASISYDQINFWIRRCLEQHPKECHSSVQKPPGLQCIDCTSRDVVLLPDGAPYVALSYVWGKPSTSVSISSSIQSNISNRGILQPIPPVIEDAMKLVLGLNQQYLWVDVFCIDQNDPKTKHEQISRMDQIYEGALLTIVASAGADATSQIPGIGHPRTHKQLIAKKGSLKLISTLFNMSSKVSSTIWATRGWTYQEAAVSRRCLYLTEVQAYFICPSQSCSEALSKGSLDVGWDHMGSLSTKVRFGHTAPGPELRQLAQHLQEFSRRKLTYHSDNLNAFRGLLRRAGFPSYFGIPIAPSDDRTSIASFRRSPIKAHIGMARGLYWTAVRSKFRWSALIRIPEFPSWSWAGWKGSVQYAEATGPGEWARGGPLMSYDRSFPPITVWIEDAQGNLEKLNKKLLKPSNTRFLPELSPYIHIEGQTVQFRLQPARFDGDTLLLCRCHFNERHQGHIDDNDLLTTFIPCTSLASDPIFAKRLLDETWTALILFRSYIYDEAMYSMLVLDLQGDFAQRIGAMTILRPLPDDLVQTRQKFKIG